MKIDVYIHDDDGDSSKTSGSTSIVGRIYGSSINGESQRGDVTVFNIAEMI